MIKVRDKVVYFGVKGEVKQILGNSALVVLEDTKEYSLPLEALKVEASSAPIVDNGAAENRIMESIRPFLKNQKFLAEFAAALSAAGVGELIIRNGSLQKFEAKETLEEKIARYKAEAMTEAEKRAREDHTREQN